MNLKYVNEDTLEKLKVNIISNIDNYLRNKSWIEEFMKDQKWSFESKINIKEIDLFLPQGRHLHFDTENTIKIYGALKDISLTQAIDERLWVYLTHKLFWNYMRKRWPVENYIDKVNPEIPIKDRYFFTNNNSRSLVRNGIARLWWYGYVSYDENREDPFELTRFLLSDTNITQNLLERTFSKNKKITKAVLSVLLKEKDLYGNAANRKKYTILMKYLNQLGGITILDALEQTELEKIMKTKLDSIV